MIEIKGTLGGTERIREGLLGEVTKDVKLKECMFGGVGVWEPWVRSG